MKQLTRFKILAALLALAACSGCSYFIQAKKCAPTGNEKYAVSIDGMLVGLVEGYSVTDGTVTLNQGIFPGTGEYAGTDFIKDWKKGPGTATKGPERHEIILSVAVSDKDSGETLIGAPLVRLERSAIVDFDGGPSMDSPDCMIVKDLVLKPTKISDATKMHSYLGVASERQPLE